MAQIMGLWQIWRWKISMGKQDLFIGIFPVFIAYFSIGVLGPVVQSIVSLTSFLWANKICLLAFSLCLLPISPLVSWARLFKALLA